MSNAQQTQKQPWWLAELDGGVFHTVASIAAIGLFIVALMALLKAV